MEVSDAHHPAQRLHIFHALSLLSARMVALLLGFLLCPVEGQCCSSSLCPLLLEKTNPFLAYEHLLPKVGVHTGFQWNTGYTDLTAPV